MAKPFTWGLPLLTKELYEQSARWQTYAFRTAYAIALFGLSLWFFGDILRQQSHNALAVLGQGREMFRTIVWLQLGGIYLFMPAMTCGAIAAEKEHNTLGVLLLTRLSPFVIVLEKLLSRLVPMCCFLLLSLPLLAYAYTLGGVTMVELFATIWLLLCTMIQIGSFSIACSTFARTTMGAFIMTYLLGTVLLVVPSVCCSAPLLSSSTNSAEHGLALALFQTLPTAFTAVVSLTIASNFLVDRAFVEPRNFLLEMFRNLDVVYTNMNQLTGGIVLVNDTVALPVDQPISWRETSKKSLGTVRYLFRILSLIEIPLLIFLTAAGRPVTSTMHGHFLPVLTIVWVIAVVLVAVHGTGLISSERSRQTLEVLLTVPLSGSEVLRQKLHGLWRMVGVMCVPFLTIFCFESWLEIQGEGVRVGEYLNWLPDFFDSTVSASIGPIPVVNLVYALLSMLAVLVYLTFIAWMSTAMGFLFRTQSRAIMTTLFVLCAWNLLPLWLGIGRSGVDIPLFVPSALILQLELKEFSIVTVVVHLSVVGAVTVGLAMFLTRHADALLGRATPRKDLAPVKAGSTA